MEGVPEGKIILYSFVSPSLFSKLHPVNVKLNINNNVNNVRYLFYI